MPHQCLKCGKIFEEGSSQLLKGCPDCKGNRFFFTKKPLDDKERDLITRKIGKDLNTKIVDLLGGENGDIFDKSGKWVKLTPKDVRNALKEHLPEETKKIKKVQNESLDPISNDDYRKKSLEKVKSEIKQSNTPETIDIEKPGEYKIDLKGLLEEEPIIIQKDGTYTIHLPSLFKMVNKEK